VLAADESSQRPIGGSAHDPSKSDVTVLRRRAW